MPEENLFENTPNNPDTPPAPVQDASTENNNPPSPDNSYADLLGSIKNSEGKPKYDSVPKALGALQHSQEHILNLTKEKQEMEQELERLRQEAEKREDIDDVVNRLTASRNEQVPGTPQPNAVDPEAINSLVKQALEADKAEQIKQNNKTSVMNSLSERFGEKARDVVSQKANELQTSVEALGSLAEQNPNLVLALFAEGTAKPANPTSTSVNLPTTPPSSDELKAPAKSLLGGSTSREQADFMRQVKERVYQRLNVET